MKHISTTGMYTKHKNCSALLPLAVSFILLSVAVTILSLFARNPTTEASRPLTFDVNVGDLVGFTVFNTARYGLNDEGAEDYAKLMPSGGHTVHLASEDGQDIHAFTVTLFHQLKYLEICHHEYLKKPRSPPTPLLRHCLNYLRQSVLCHADTRLESIKNAEVQSSKEYETVCRDWTQVYDAAERNHASYKKLVNNTV
ncbi:hypothetical protein R3P38DRAFT_304545 [Favolaschia claudopus]|uniref:Uncharacterized protein n=1 Tax=Favolaschia claudopus TaxID=2862362 RepID=A0AAW0CPL1_9AGAR